MNASMPALRRHGRSASAFTLIELVAVIVVLAILAGVAIPKYIDYAANAKSSACKGILGGVRSAIANFYSNSAVSGTVAYPTLVQLQTVGTVVTEAVPANPYNNLATITAVSWTTLQPVSGSFGWNYDATTGRFWANSNTVGENLY
jgi:MSHA pilin protein MshA